MNKYNLGGHSGCQIFLIEEDDGSVYVRKISKDKEYNSRLKIQSEKQASFSGDPIKAQQMLELMKDADIVFCESDHAETSEQVESVDNVKIECWDQKTQLYEFMKHKRMTGMLWNKLIRRNLTEDVWFNEKTGYGEDAEFLWKILKKSGKMIVTNEILYHHVLEETSISHLSFSEKKYSAIPMWENINKEVEKEYPDLLELAKERLMSAAIFSLYEAKNCGYKNKIHITYMRKIARKYIGAFLKSPNISKKFKLYALAVCMGY